MTHHQEQHRRSYEELGVERAERLADRADARSEHREEQAAQQTEWKQFLHDADDRLLTLHGPVVSGLTRFKRLVLIGLTIALLGVFAALIGVKYQSDQADKNLKSACVDRRASQAIRHQWKRVNEIIKDREAGKLTPDQASQMFIRSYDEAIKEAGPAPNCPSPP